LLCQLAEDGAIERITDTVLAQPRRHPAGLVWLAEGAGGRTELLTRSPLRLLQQVMTALVQDEFKPTRARLNKAIESEDFLPHLIQALDVEQGEQAEKALVRAHLEEYVRTPLVNALHLRFPEQRRETSTALYALASSIERRREELRELKTKEIPANRRAIEEAREMGDLRENFEYKAARQRHEYLSSRLAELDGDLSRARPIDTSRDDSAEVRIASSVLLDEGGEELRLTILGPWESAPEAGVISYDSDLGRALLGKAVDEELQFGDRSFKLLSIEPYRTD
jgi:transcription elongation GreA/GreB family factor